MSFRELIAEFESEGVTLTLEDERVLCQLPPEYPQAALERLRAVREEVRFILRERQRNLPPAPPVVLTRCSIVTNVRQFVATTLKQLEHAWRATSHFWPETGASGNCWSR